MLARDQRPTSSAIVFRAAHDHNGALSLDSSDVESNIIELGKKHHIYYQEGSTVLDFTESIEDLSGRSHLPITVLYFLTHADSECMGLDEPDYIGGIFDERFPEYVTTMLDASAIASVREKLPDLEVMLFNACNVGEAGGLAERVSASFQDVLVIASNDTVRGLNISFTDDRLKEASYTEDGVQYFYGQIYKNGQLVSLEDHQAELVDYIV